MKNVFKKFSKEQLGTTLVEYGVALILVVVVGTLAINELANAVSGELQETASAF